MKLYTLKESAVYVGLSLNHFKHQKAKYMIPMVKGKTPKGALQYFIEQSELDKYMETRRKHGIIKRPQPNQKEPRMTAEEYNKWLRAECGLPYKPLDYRYQPLADGLA